MPRATINRDFIPNQVFVGLPWKNVRPRYERIIRRLEIKFPLNFDIVGRNDRQSAEDLFEIIKSRIASSSVAIFDATTGNPNVSLEYGYAEGINVERTIYLSTHKKATQPTEGIPIISDLGGRRRIQYKTENNLSVHLHNFCRTHPYTQRFEKFVRHAFSRLKKGEKKSNRTLALKIIHTLDGIKDLRRDDLVQRVQSQGYPRALIEDMVKLLHDSGLVNCEVGRYSRVHVE